MEVKNLLQMPFLATSIFTWSDCRLCSSPKIIPAPQVPQWVSLIFEMYCQLPNNLTSGTAPLVEASVSQTKANHLRPQRTGYELLIATLDQWTRIAGKLLILFFFSPAKAFEVNYLLNIIILETKIFEGRLSSSAPCPVVNELLPFPFWIFFTCETDTQIVLLSNSGEPSSSPRGIIHPSTKGSLKIFITRATSISPHCKQPPCLSGSVI